MRARPGGVFRVAMTGLAAAVAIGGARAPAQNARANIIPGNPPPPPTQQIPLDWLLSRFNPYQTWYDTGNELGKMLYDPIAMWPPPGTPPPVGSPYDNPFYTPPLITPQVPFDFSSDRPSGGTGGGTGGGYFPSSYPPSSYPFSRPSRLGGPISISIHGFAGLDAFSTRSSGVPVSDTAGLISSPNALVGHRSSGGGGGINLSIDASRPLDLAANQRLWFDLTGDFHYTTATFTTSGLTPGQANANAGSAQSNIYTVKAAATYMINNWYLSGRALLDFSHTDITNNLTIPGARGDTN